MRLAHTETAIEDMRKRAYEAQGWQDDGTRSPASEEEREDRAFAAGVEAGILWVIGHTGDPLPRR